VLGWISDNVGREKTLAVAFAVEALAVFAFGRYGRTPVSFVLLAACVSFAWGEIYSIFPSLTRDHFGQRYAATNYGMLYTAKGLGSFLVPFAATIVAMTKSWTTVVDIVVALDLIAAVLTIGLLLPLRKREIAHSRVRDPDLATGIAEALPS
jgi:OFA family oxalate/formate antiporter-like MFS transporter